jgi:hypothetical protein
VRKIIFITAFMTVITSHIICHADSPNCLCELVSGDGSEYIHYIRLSGVHREYRMGPAVT